MATEFATESKEGLHLIALLHSQIYYEGTKSSVLVCVKGKRDLHQQKQGLQVEGSDVFPPLSTWNPAAGVVSSFGLLSRRETWTHLSKHITRELARGWRGAARGQAETQSRACSAWGRVRGHPPAVCHSLTPEYKDDKAWLILEVAPGWDERQQTQA